MPGPNLTASQKILKGENWGNPRRSPLTALGFNVKEGDYILAVNGVPTRDMNNIYEALINTVGKQVELTVNSKPNNTGSRNITVMPIASEACALLLQLGANQY